MGSGYKEKNIEVKRDQDTIKNIEVKRDQDTINKMLKSRGIRI